VSLKSLEEILAQLREIIHRHRRRFIRKRIRPCPTNCVYADISRKGVHGCSRCNSTNPEVCRVESNFVPMDTKEELAEQFAIDLRDPLVLQHEYRDVMSLLWVLGAFDGDEPDENIIGQVEYRRPT